MFLGSLIKYYGWDVKYDLTHNLDLEGDSITSFFVFRRQQSTCCKSLGMRGASNSYLSEWVPMTALTLRDFLFFLNNWGVQVFSPINSISDFVPWISFTKIN